MKTGKRVEKTEAEWEAILAPEAFRVCRKKGTEKPFEGRYWDCHDPGVYRCVCCGSPLFQSTAKFDSGTGWPSFSTPTKNEAVHEKEDRSLFMRRTEVLCSVCDAHLGHVFDDGPAPSGKRYCVNSAALDFEEDGA